MMKHPCIPSFDALLVNLSDTDSTSDIDLILLLHDYILVKWTSLWMARVSSTWCTYKLSVAANEKWITLDILFICFCRTLETQWGAIMTCYGLNSQYHSWIGHYNIMFIYWNCLHRPKAKLWYHQYICLSLKIHNFLYFFWFLL